MLCNNCGENLPEGKKFCGSCGQSATVGSVTAESAPKKKNPLQTVGKIIGGFFVFSIVVAMFSDGDSSTPSSTSNSGNSGNSTSQNANEETIARPEEEILELNPEQTSDFTPEPEVTADLIQETVNEDGYEYVEYETLLRGGHDWIGKKVKFDGIVTQVLYDTEFTNTVFETLNSGTFCNIILDSNLYSYEEKLVVGVYVIPEGEMRFLSGDYVTLYGTFSGLEQFEMASGAPESFPVLDVQLASFTDG